jgi:hypothetical protein
LWWPCLLSTCGGHVCCPINMKWGSFIKDSNYLFTVKLFFKDQFRNKNMIFKSCYLLLLANLI